LYIPPGSVRWPRGHVINRRPPIGEPTFPSMPAGSSTRELGQIREPRVDSGVGPHRRVAASSADDGRGTLLGQADQLTDPVESPPFSRCLPLYLGVKPVGNTHL
jgi:hypothetical protein